MQSCRRQRSSPRAEIGAFILVAVIRALGYTFLRRRTWTPYVVLAIVGNCLPFWFITWGQQHIDSALAGILMAVMPLVTLVLAHRFVSGERMTLARVGGFVLGFAGMVVLMGPAALNGLGGAPIEIVASVRCSPGLYVLPQRVIARVMLRGDVMVERSEIAVAALISCGRLVLDKPWHLAPTGRQRDHHRIASPHGDATVSTSTDLPRVRRSCRIDTWECVALFGRDAVARRTRPGVLRDLD